MDSEQKRLCVKCKKVEKHYEEALECDVENCKNKLNVCISCTSLCSVCDIFTCDAHAKTHGEPCAQHAKQCCGFMQHEGCFEDGCKKKEENIKRCDFCGVNVCRTCRIEVPPNHAMGFPETMYLCQNDRRLSRQYADPAIVRPMLDLLEAVENWSTREREICKDCGKYVDRE